MKETKKKAAEVLLDLLYPPRCPICDELLGRRERYVCDSCRKKLPWIVPPSCMKCGKQIAVWEQEYCPDCQKTQHLYEQGLAAFSYTGALRQSVYRMKFENRRDYLEFYAAAMEQIFYERGAKWKPDQIVAVPMHWKKKRRRGYNQSELLAEKISHRIGIPFEKKLLRCVQVTASQKELNRRERLENLSDSFVLDKKTEIGTTILVIDDVYTTGSTMDAVARVLKKGGAKHVYFLVLCTGKGKKPVFTKDDL